MVRFPNFKPVEYVAKNVEPGDNLATYHPNRMWTETLPIKKGDSIYVTNLEDPEHFILIFDGRACDISREKFELHVKNGVFVPRAEYTEE